MYAISCHGGRVGHRRPRRANVAGTRDLPATLSLDPGHQGRQVDRQRPCKPVDVHKTHVPQPALDAAEDLAGPGAHPLSIEEQREDIRLEIRHDGAVHGNRSGSAGWTVEISAPRSSRVGPPWVPSLCLLYTSDAADESRG